MECPLLIYKDGRFTTGEPMPDWYAKMLADDGDDWDAAIEKAGLTEFGSLNTEQLAPHVNLFIHEDTFYAECSDGLDVLWCATFGWVDLPLFLSQFVIPLINGRSFRMPEEIFRAATRH